MKSNYETLGKYIHEVDVRNSNLSIKTLLGVSITKDFIPSVANIVGTDMANYKIVKKGQFACKLMSVGRDEQLPVDLLKDYDEALVSSAYYVFEVTNIDELLSEYLLMWLSRPEFDRYVGFISGSDVRGGISWEDFCNSPIKVPHIDKQREIVKEYNTILNCIDLNNGLIQKLEETAQAIYKQWFVDFEFSNKNGEPYKSAGGEMAESELGDIPAGWEVKTVGSACKIYDYLRRPLSEIERREIQGIYPYYGAMSIVDYVNDYIFEGIYLLFSEDGANVIDEKGHPSLQYIWGKFWVNNHAHILQGDKIISTEFLYLTLKNSNVSDLVTGAAQPKINQDNMSSIKLIVPDEERLKEFNRITSPFFAHLRAVTETNNRVERLRDILLSKLATVEN